jgi:hypothetical protein
VLSTLEPLALTSGDNQAMVYTYRMARRLVKTIFLLTIPFVLLAHNSGADTVYRTVGEDGVVSFSDKAPEDTANTEKVNIVVAEPASDDTTQQRLEDMRETTDRMVADRMAREKHRAELGKLQAEQQYSNDEPYRMQGSVEYQSEYYYPQHYFRPIRPGHRPGHGNRPNRPNRPHIEPYPDYNDYPASLIRRSYNPQVREAVRHTRR